MFVHTIINPNSFPLLSASPLSEHNIYDLKDLDFKVFIKSVEVEKRNDAVLEVKALFSLVLAMFFNGELPKVPRLVYFKLNPPIITYDEFCKKLDMLSKIKRYTLLFALDNQLHINDVVKLTWSDLDGLEPLSVMSSLIIEELNKHPESELVFFELKNNQPCEIIDMNEEVRRINNNMSYPETLRMYLGSVKSNEYQAKEFIRLIQNP